MNPIMKHLAGLELGSPSSDDDDLGPGLWVTTDAGSTSQDRK